MPNWTTSASFYLIEGDPGSGKTTLALEFILEGVRSGEKTLYIALSESEIDLRRIARSHGWELDGVQIVDLTVGEEALSSDEQSTMYHPSEIELGEVTRSILEEVKRSQADRIVIDSVAEIRRLSNSSIRYRRQLMALKSFFRGRKNTVLLLDDRMEAEDLDLQAVARGTITLERRSPDYGRVRRRLQITKMRGQRIHTGYHDFVIESGGLEIFPRMIAWEKAGASEEEVFSSRIDSLDRLLGGGIERGTCTLVMGAAGTGKSSICSQYAVAAAQRGEKAFIWVFDEAAGNFLRRCDGLGLPLRKYREEGLIKLRQVDPAELSPGEFAWAVRNSVEDDGAGLIVIDSLNGYLSSMPDEEYLKGQFHELSTYIN